MTIPTGAHQRSPTHLVQRAKGKSGQGIMSPAYYGAANEPVRRKKLNMSYWEPRVCYVKDEWFWWTDNALDDEPAGIVNFSDPGTSFRTELNKPYIYITAAGQTLTFKVVATATDEWACALGRAAEIGEEKRKNGKIEHSVPSFPALPRKFFPRENSKNYYAFTSGYFRDVVYNLMLFKQRELLHEGCATYLNTRIVEYRENFELKGTGKDLMGAPLDGPTHPRLKQLTEQRNAHRSIVNKIRQDATADDEKDRARRMKLEKQAKQRFPILAVKAAAKFKSKVGKNRWSKARKCKTKLASTLAELHTNEPRKSMFNLSRPSIRLPNTSLSSTAPQEVNENAEFKRKLLYITWLRDRRNAADEVNPVKSVPGNGRVSFVDASWPSCFASNISSAAQASPKKGAKLHGHHFDAIKTRGLRKRTASVPKTRVYSSARRASL